ncbi:hypothetical protein BD408DRAFT_419509 [Parasitella parasitica]|nr:hypothetical protein BD408DRAFT_419509 [Parasitella parasitica]
MGVECYLYLTRQVKDFCVLETVDYITFTVTLKAFKENSTRKSSSKMGGILAKKEGEKKK